jgi:hypothetical protein
MPLMAVMFLTQPEKSNFSYGIYSKWSVGIFRIRSWLLPRLVGFNVDLLPIQSASACSDVGSRPRGSYSVKVSEYPVLRII